MTLHDQVRNPKSQLRAVLSRHAVGINDWKDVIARACADRAVIEPAGEGIPWSALGHAVSARLTWALDGGVGDVVASVAGALGQGATDLVDQVAATTPTDHDPGEAAAISWWIGQLDRLGRHRRPDDPDLATLRQANSIEELVARAPDRWVDDIVAVAAANAAAVAQLRDLGEGVVVVAPTFVGSPLVGGADADLIVGTALVEIKTTRTARPALRDLHQMLGYALLDYDDALGMECLSYWSARYGALAIVETDRYLDDVVAARADFVATFGNSSQAS